MTSIIETYFNDAITITPKGTINADATYSYDGTPVVTTGWDKKETGMFRDADGKEWQYTHVIHMASDETIALQDQITSGGVSLEIRGIEEQDDINSNLDHYKVFCG